MSLKSRKGKHSRFLHILFASYNIYYYIPKIKGGFGHSLKFTMIRILHVVSALDTGGVEMMLLNYYQHFDKSKMKFDFLINGNHIGIIGKKFIDLGSFVGLVPPNKVNFLNNILGTFKILKKQPKYDIVHSHMNHRSFLVLCIAWLCGIKVRIAHSHNAESYNSIFIKLRHQFYSFLVRLFANQYYACGNAAGEWLFGKRVSQHNGFIVIRNAIDIEKFIFNNEARIRLRKELKIEDKFVFGNIGRLSLQKNQKFLLDVFKEYLCHNKNCILLIIGDGDLLQDLFDYSREIMISEYVKFLGKREDIPALLSSMDLFILPSLFEGFPVSLIEAQVNGLPCLVADSITKDSQLTEYVQFTSLSNKTDQWVKDINNLLDSFPGERHMDLNLFRNLGFEIKQESSNFENQYFSLLGCPQDEIWK